MGEEGRGDGVPLCAVQARRGVQERLWRKAGQHGRGEVVQGSAEKGFADAQYQLGCLYSKGTGVRKDIKEARSWWEKAAQQGDEKSKLSLRRLRASAYRQGACAAALMCGMVLAVVLA